MKILVKTNFIRRKIKLQNMNIIRSRNRLNKKVDQTKREILAKTNKGEKTNFQIQFQKPIA